MGERWKKEDVLAVLLRDTERFIKRDEHVRILTFLTGISAYTDNPLNLFLKGESGAGKTYVSKSIISTYFPKEDVWMLGGITPKVLVRLHGIEMAKDGRRIEEIPFPQKPDKKSPNYEEEMERYQQELKEYRELIRDGYMLIDLSGKILLFLEAPDIEAFQLLRAILGHDDKEISYPLVEKTKQGQQRTKNVKVRGWPACIFCTADLKYVEELATRSLTASPEISEEKIREAQKVLTEKAAAPWNFHDTEDTVFLRWVVSQIKYICKEYKVLIPSTNLHEVFPKEEVTRHMRDYDHFIAIVKAITLLYFPQRTTIEKDGQKYVLAAPEDVITALKIFQRIYETTETGTEERILLFYKNVVVKQPEWRIKDLTEEYNKNAKRKVGRETIYKWLRVLEDIGYVDSEPDPDDRRLRIYRPIRMDILDTGSHPQENLIKKGFEEWWKLYAPGQPTIGPQNIYLFQGGSVYNILSGPPRDSFSQVEPENIRFFENRTSNEELKEAQKYPISGKSDISFDISPTMKNAEMSDIRKIGHLQPISENDKDIRFQRNRTFSSPVPPDKPGNGSTQISYNNPPGNRYHSSRLDKEWDELSKRIQQLQETCENCVYYDECNDRSKVCEKYTYKYAVQERKKATEQLVHKMTYEDKIKELGDGWTAYSLPRPKKCVICGSEAILGIRRWNGQEMEQKEICLSCFSLLRNVGGIKQ